MGNQAEQIEDDRGVEKSQHEAQVHDKPLPEVVVATSGEVEMNDKQSLKRIEKTATNGSNPSPSEDKGLDGNPNLFVPQYEYPDGEDEVNVISNVDGKDTQTLEYLNLTLQVEMGKRKRMTREMVEPRKKRSCPSTKQLSVSGKQRNQRKSGRPNLSAEW